MLRQLSDSVMIRLPCREALIFKLKSEAKLVADAFDEIEEMILFGSLARGDFGIDSDADILIILGSSLYERYFDRIPKYSSMFLEFDIPVDVFPYTRTEIDEMIKRENSFIINILKEGISLYL